ncbi:Flagellar hook-associated protein 2 [Planctomycetes bacterium Poly30]|uniref:Flagellar hook-associated protein 2 n=1 Tax=Saltatorellus ferox TaxID=2528018 RepID=A0A518ELP2_9BACT|nr:Flagellar hook-associated protein 2 [Planctomycetes bacterium Poly30]
MVSSSGISFSGLGSGLDTAAIVSQLVSIERIPIRTIETRRGTEQKKLDLVGQLGDLVKKLKTKAEALASPEEFYAYASSISDESVATVTTDSNAQPGTHTLDVQRMAATDRWAFDANSSRDQNLASGPNELISFKVGTTDYSLTLDENDSSLDRIASQIEAMAGDVVSASVVNTGTESSPSFQLVLSSKVSGEEGRLTDIFSNVGQDPLATGEGLGINYAAPDAAGNSQSDNNITVGNDALAEIDGLLIRRSTNSFTEVIEGVTIDVRAMNDSGPVTISIEADRDAVRGRIDEFISTYNEVMDFIDKQSTFTPSTDADDNGGTTGLLFGDSIVSSVKRSIQSALFNVDVNSAINDTSGYSTLNLVGIEQDRNGRLSVDATVFDEKFAQNLPALMDLFADTDGFDNGGAEANTPGYNVDTTADTGLMAKLIRGIDQMFGRQASGSSSINIQGVFDLRKTAIQDSIKRYDSQIARREDRLSDYEERLTLQYARLEEVMAGLNAQGSALNAVLGG